MVDPLACRHMDVNEREKPAEQCLIPGKRDTYTLQFRFVMYGSVFVLLSIYVSFTDRCFLFLPSSYIIHSYTAHWTALTMKALTLQMARPLKNSLMPPS